MVETDKGEEIVRISIVDYEENIILDKYIKPIGKIVDYRANITGIDNNVLKNAIDYEELLELLKFHNI